MGKSNSTIGPTQPRFTAIVGEKLQEPASAKVVGKQRKSFKQFRTELRDIEYCTFLEDIDIDADLAGVGDSSSSLVSTHSLPPAVVVCV